MSWGPWVDLQHNDEDLEEEMKNAPAGIAFGRMPKKQYPWGMRLSFSEKELRKMECSARDFKVGEIMDIRAMGSVTSVREEEGNCCVEIQIERIATENESEEEPPGPQSDDGGDDEEE